MATIGDAIDTKAKEYIALYESLKADEKFSSSAESLAKHDLSMAIYIDTQVLEQLCKHIQEDDPEK